MRRQIQGNRLDTQTGHQNSHPPPVQPLTKTPGAPEAEGDKKQQDGGKLKGSSTAARLKAVMGMNTSAEPPAIHLPWNKARVGPMEDGKEGEDVRLGNREAGKSENKKGRKNEAVESSLKKEQRGELGIWGRDSRHSMTNGRMKNSAVQGGGNRPEHGRELPGLVGLDGSLVIDGSYFQTFTGASMPAPAKQKLNEAFGLISLVRRMQEPTRVGDEHWSNRKSRERGGDSREMYGSIGDMSVSAAVSARRRTARRWEGETGSRDSMTEQSDSETGSGSRESPSEFSLSDRSSPTSSATTETEINESDLEMESDDEGRGEDEEVSDSYEESGTESEDEEEESSRERSKGQRYASKSSKHGNSSTDSKRYSSSTAPSPNMLRDSGSYKRSGKESEDNSEEGRGGNVRLRKSAASRRSSIHVGSGVMDTSDDLSPIMEDTEDEEKSSSQSGGRHKEEDEVWGNESAA